MVRIGIKHVIFLKVLLTLNLHHTLVTIHTYKKSSSEMKLFNGITQGKATLMVQNSFVGNDSFKSPPVWRN